MKMPAGYDDWKLRSDRDDEERHMWYPRRDFTQMEGRPMDIADFSGELANLVQEALDSGIEVSEVKATLHAKLAELDAGQALEGNQDNDNGEEDEPDAP